MRKPNGYWTKERMNEHLYEKINELRRVPTQSEIGFSASDTIKKGRYQSDIKNWNQFLRYHGFEIKHNCDKWTTSDKINEFFYQRLNELRRVPDYNDLGESLCASIRSGIIPGVKSLIEFLEYHGFESKRDKWTTSKINGCFYDAMNHLRRIPKAKEFDQGALSAIENGRYSPNIRTWNHFLKHHGLDLRHEPGKWTTQRLHAYFYDRLNELRRIPTQKEVKSGMLGAIRKRLIPGVRSYNQYLRYLELEPNCDIGKWTAKSINNHFYDKINELRRVPNGEEFNKSIQQSLTNGIIPRVRTYNQFLKYHGFEPIREIGKWIPEKINEAFYDKINKLRRIPIQKEMDHGALTAINRRKYRSDITSWNEFLDYHGFEPNNKGAGNSILEDVLK